MESADTSAAFEVTESAVDVETLVVGFTEYGLAGLTAVDYLTEQLGMANVGHLQTSEPPTITPFEDGVPRHHTRLYVDVAESLAVVISERIVPPGSAAGFADAVDGLCDELDPTNLTVLTGVPVAHGPDDHVPFYIATPEYRARYLDGTGIRPMGTGFLDGVTAELVARRIDDGERPAGVFTTPAHPQAPDAAAAIRLLEALDATHDIGVDTEALETFAATVESQYRALAERLKPPEEEPMSDDRMYM